MGKSSGLGLEELMIVNPIGAGEPNAFLAEDGTLYALSTGGEALADAPALFLGEDGSVYRAEPVAAGNASPGHAGIGAELAAPEGREYLLGADGRLYELEI